MNSLVLLKFILHGAQYSASTDVARCKWNPESVVSILNQLWNRKCYRKAFIGLKKYR